MSTAIELIPATNLAPLRPRSAVPWIPMRPSHIPRTPFAKRDRRKLLSRYIGALDGNDID